MYFYDINGNQTNNENDYYIQRLITPFNNKCILVDYDYKSSDIFAGRKIFKRFEGTLSESGCKNLKLDSYGTNGEVEMFIYKKNSSNHPTNRALISKVILKDGYIYQRADKNINTGEITYQGCKDGNCINGYGTYVLTDGSIYKGYFKDGLFYGNGTFYDTSENQKYNGNFVNGEIKNKVSFNFTKEDVKDCIQIGNDFLNLCKGVLNFAKEVRDFNK